MKKKFNYHIKLMYNKGACRGSSIHADREKNISDHDMMVLNKFVHNRLTYVLELIMQERWAEFALVVESQKFYGSEWDKSEPDDGGTKELILWQLEAGASKEE